MRPGALQSAPGVRRTAIGDANAVAGAQNAAGKDKMHLFETGVTYQLSPGIEVMAGFNYVMGSGPSKSGSADGWALFFGTELRF